MKPQSEQEKRSLADRSLTLTLAYKGSVCWSWVVGRGFQVVGRGFQVVGRGSWVPSRGSQVVGCRLFIGRDLH